MSFLVDAIGVVFACGVASQESVISTKMYMALALREIILGDIRYYVQLGIRGMFMMPFASIINR
jgi:hypothetical protein